MAVEVLGEMGIDMKGRTASSLESAQRQRYTYDVYVSIDSPYSEKGSDAHQRASSSRQLEHVAPSETYSDPLLAHPMPSHWSIAFDATDARQKWDIWSPRDPSIYHQNSTRRFQDDLYEGEPLFMRPQMSLLRRAAKVSDRWELAEVGERYAMESEEEQLKRFRIARNTLCTKCVHLLRRLEDYYGETLLTNEKPLKCVPSTAFVASE
ncbi:hypothetical protein AGDE_06515 [Angomonas deanei]|nr:hypothetical protein AGDE_06515 [Angomonas deanei]|eukprot:EPY37419.1 hypothetical protein AGDE_06515 [Angomonas deanei]